MFLTVKRCIHTKFGWIWSSELSASNKFSLKSVKNWNFVDPQKASKQAEADDVLNRSESLTPWEFKKKLVFKIGQLLLHKQLTLSLLKLHKIEISCLSSKELLILKIQNILNSQDVKIQNNSKRLQFLPILKLFEDPQNFNSGLI